MTIWMVYEIVSVPKGNLGIYDPTEIHNRGQLKMHMRNCMINLGYYLLFFFVYLYWWVIIVPFIIFITIYSCYCSLIIALLSGDPINRHDENVIVSNLGEF